MNDPQIYDVNPLESSEDMNLLKTSPNSLEEKHFFKILSKFFKNFQKSLKKCFLATGSGKQVMDGCIRGAPSVEWVQSGEE